MELVKLVVLVALATSCYGQSGVSSVDVQPTTASTSIITVTASRAYRNESSYQELYDNGLYVSSQSYRYAHYNCHVRNASGFITNRLEDSFIFSIFLQMPVLHFLNLPYKRALMESIRTLLDIPSTSDPPEICVDGYDQAFVGEFEEGVLLRIYQRSGSVSGQDLVTNFGKSLDRGGIGNPPLTRFEGVRAINYSEPNGRAAVIGDYWSGRVSINFREECRLDTNNAFGDQMINITCRFLTDDQQNDLKDRLAENPNPRNLYLEGGDYVFAVLGAIVVAIVLGLAILGYFIHPFFLA